MHIVFVTTELASNNNSSGGLASFTSNIAKIFAQQGHQVSVVLASTKNVSIEFDSNVNIYSLFVPMYKWKLMDFFSKIFGRITREDIDEMRKMFVNLNKARQVKKIVRNINRRDKIDLIHYCNHGSLNLLTPEKIPYVVRISGFLNIWNGVNVSDGSIQYTDNPLSIKDKLEEYTT